MPIPPAERDFQPDVERAWLAGAWEYGALIHQSHADALIRALGEASEPAIGHALFSRLYGEMIAGTETFAAWMLAFRNREKHGLLNAYLAYEPREVGSVYADVAVPTFMAAKYLRLPTAAQMVAATGSLPTPMSMSVATNAAGVLESRVRRFADFRKQKIALLLHNSLKHGAPVVRLDPSNPATFEAIIANKAWPGPPGTLRYEFAKLTVNRSEVEKYRANIEEITRGIRDFASLASILSDAKALYSGGEIPSGVATT